MACTGALTFKLAFLILDGFEYLMSQCQLKKNPNPKVICVALSRKNFLIFWYILLLKIITIITMQMKAKPSGQRFHWFAGEKDP